MKHPNIYWCKTTVFFISWSQILWVRNWDQAKWGEIIFVLQCTAGGWSLMEAHPLTCLGWLNGWSQQDYWLGDVHMASPCGLGFSQNGDWVPKRASKKRSPREWAVQKSKEGTASLLLTDPWKSHRCCCGYVWKIQPITPVSYTHLTLPTRRDSCRSRWSPYH